MDRNYIVDLLSIFFGLGTWLCVNGLWVELPLLVQRLPEGWNLPSYLSVVTQISNVAPLTYSTLHFFYPKWISEKWSIYFVMCIGLVSTVLLANFWEETTYVGGEEHSTALIALVFFLASVDCSSRVLYLPFMARFQVIYLSSYFIGEGLSGFVPSIVALIQGTGGNPECIEIIHENGTSELQSRIPEPRFSVDAFFYVLFAFTLFSAVAFYLLNVESITKSARLHDANYLTDVTKENPQISSSTEKSYLISIKKPSYMALILLQMFICAFSNGVFPSIVSYSCLPYGNVVYHLAVTLSNMANPAVCFLGPFLPPPSKKSVSWISVVSLTAAGYVMTTAIESPEPPLVGNVWGEILLIASWILMVGSFTYVRVSIASLMREENGKKGLFLCGAVTQFGSAVGAFVTFFIVNHTNVFQGYYPC